MSHNRPQPPSSTIVAWCWVLAFAIIGLNFALQGRLGMDLADEGFLYYGVLRVRAGEIPLADFQSYEPYRYYWCAAWTWLLGDSVYAVRAATALIGAIGLAMGLLAVARVIQSPWLLLLTGIAIASSNVLWYRQFDTAAALIAIWIAVRVAEHATARGTFTAGVLVALIAGFGRNHGFYSAVAVLAVIITVTWHTLSRAKLSMLGGYFAGIVVGYLPIIAHCIYVPNYFSTFWNDILRELLTGTTNIPLPVPWPWLLPLGTLAWPNAVLPLGISILFVAVPLTYALTVILLSWHFDRNDPVHRLLLATLAVGVLYLHHAFSRADGVHLLEGIQAFIPTVVALLAVAGHRAPWIRPRAILVVGIFVPFLIVNAFHQPRIVLVRSPPGAYSLIDANGSTLEVPWQVVSVVAALREIKTWELRAGETLLLAPHWPMAYALLRLRSPIWEIYHLFARTEAFQREEIADLERHHVVFAVFADSAIDNRDDRRMSAQTPLFYRYLLDNYAPIEGPALPAPYRLYRRTTPLPPWGRPDSPSQSSNH